MAIYLTEKENMRGNARGNSYGLKFHTGNKSMPDQRQK